MSLQDRLDAFKAEFEGGRFALKPSREALTIMHRATAELSASGLAGRALKASDVAPDFTLNDADGDAVSARRLLAKGPLVVSFYRGVWCPYCNLELQPSKRFFRRSRRAARALLRSHLRPLPTAASRCARTGSRSPS